MNGEPTTMPLAYTVFFIDLNINVNLHLIDELKYECGILLDTEKNSTHAICIFPHNK